MDFLSPPSSQLTWGDEAKLTGHPLCDACNEGPSTVSVGHGALLIAQCLALAFPSIARRKHCGPSNL